MGKQVQTKRNSRNKHNWEKQVGYAVRVLNKAKYFKVVILSKFALDKLKVKR